MGQNPIKAYTRWLHTRWPAGTVEKLPLVRDGYTCNVPGVYIVGDLTGVPLLKFSLDSGAKAVRHIAEDPKLLKERTGDGELLDIVIIGGGVAGMAAAVEATRQKLSYKVLETNRAFSTIANFPARKPIYTYPNDMTPEGELQVSAEVKEDLLDELQEQVRGAGVEPLDARAEGIRREGNHLVVDLAGGESLKARRVIVAIGRSGNFRKLGVPGEELDKVNNRLHDPKDYMGKQVLVVGGGDSALEAAAALVHCGAHVILSYRKPEFSRPKPENAERIRDLAEDPDPQRAEIEEPSSERITTASGEWVMDRSGLKAPPRGSLRLMMSSNVKQILDKYVIITNEQGEDETFENDAVFPMIGREPPLDFFRRSGIAISGETRALGWGALGLFLVFCVWMYLWKGGGPTEGWTGTWPGNMPNLIAGLGGWFESMLNDRSTLIGTVAVSMQSRSFYYTLAYCLAVVVFGVARILRRKTPYVKVQTTVLMLIQVVPLFLLPEIVLPHMGYNGWFDKGAGAVVADGMFERYISPEDDIAGNYAEGSHPRAYWRAYGLILAWPLMVYNIFTDEPMMWWLVIGFLQTFVIIPGMIYFWGKGSYCGWICSCGALAETVGDTQRHKMPHVPFWNRLNMAGQVILWGAFVMLGLRIIGWAMPGSWADRMFDFMLYGNVGESSTFPLAYKWLVDTFLAGIIGVGLYFKYSGRVWCRFFCPLAALMHIYTRFSRFAILSEKKKCISCNVCTSVCHQGIDVMNFANKGVPMQDVECVRCSACVQSCPTGVLSFGQIDRDGTVIDRDTLGASPVLMAEEREKATTRS